jgi:amino acid permease
MSKALSEPLLARDDGRGTPSSSTLSSAIVLAKVIVGTGLFALPPAIRAAGWLLSSVMVVLLALVTTYTMVIIIRSIRVLRSRFPDALDGRIEFQEMTAAAFPGALMNGVIIFICVLGQLGSIMASWAFAASNIMSLSPYIQRWQVILACAGFLAPLSLLRTTSHPAFQAAMGFGNIAVGLAVATVLYGGFAQGGLHPLEKRIDVSGVGVAFGVTVFMLTGYMEVVSIEQDMRSRPAFERMLASTFVAVTALYLAFGIAVYSFFGEATGRVWQQGHWAAATIMENLQSGWVTNAVKVTFSVNLLLMSPIVLLPASKAIEDALALTAKRPLLQRAARLGLVAAMGGASLMPAGFEVITAVVGCLTGITAFSIPALCYLRLAEPLPCAHRAWLYLVVAIGICGTTYAMAQLVSSESATPIYQGGNASTPPLSPAEGVGTTRPPPHAGALPAHPDHPETHPAHPADHRG